MSGQGRPWTFWLTIMLFAVAGHPALSAQTIDWPRNIAAHHDCQLNDVHFRDAENGLAVGQRGLLLVTTDGGNSWQVQNLDVDCDLETICFATPAIGWVAGGYRLPHASSSRGVLFETRDGGQSWQSIQGLDIPRIHKLLFHSTREGFAICDSGPGRPGGVLTSDDGGRSWTATAESEPAAWHAADISPDRRIAIASRSGQVAHARDTRWRTATRDQLSPAAINDICLLDQQYGFAVGDQGLVAQTTDGGRSWQPAEIVTDWPAEAPDFQVVCNAQNRIWIAGDPGGILFRLSAGQRHWTRLTLPVRSPVTSLCFIDEQTGWAVTRLGDILQTGDGGQSWSVQRRGARGVALLQLATAPQGFCAELFARFCGDQGYVGGALLVSPPDNPGSPCNADDAGQALARVGGSFVCQVPAGIVTPRPVPDPSDQRLREYLVRQIRTLQPRVISLDTGQGTPDYGFDLRGEVLAAVRDAADPAQFAAGHTELGLSPWQVAKVILVDRSGGGGTGISGQEYLTRMSCLVGDYAMPSCHLLGQFRDTGSGISLQTIYTSPLMTGRGGSLMDSIERLDGQIPRRRQSRPASGNMVSMRQLASKSKRLDGLLEFAARPDGTTARFAAELASLCANLDEPTAGVWLYELGQQFLTRGQTAFARFSFTYFLDQYHNHPLALAAALQLYDDFSSAEMAMLARHQIRQAHATQRDAIQQSTQIKTRTRPVTRYNQGIATTVWEPVAEESNEPGTAIRQVGFLDSQLERLASVRQQQAWSAGQSVAILDPAALDSTQRILSRIRLSQKMDPGISLEESLKKVAAVSPEHSLVSSAALRELTVERKGPAAAARRFGIACASATRRPWLDGKLDDPIWQSSRDADSRLTLVDDTDNVRQTVLLACDSEFLFVGITCRRLQRETYPDPVLSRERDAQTSRSDAITIRIDTDRDYLTSFQLVVDSAGRVADRCGDAVGWDPQWYVANRLDEQNWYSEIAIPLNELCLPGAEPLWSIGVARTIRDTPAAAWWQSDLAGAEVPDPEFRIARLANGFAADPIHPDSWAMVLMPWQKSESKPELDPLPPIEAADSPAGETPADK